MVLTMAVRMFLLSLVLTTLMVGKATAQNAATFFITAPNVFRVGVEETLIVSLIEPRNVEVSVDVFLQRPGLRVNFATKRVTVSSDNPQEVTLRVDLEDLARNEGQFQHVKLGARSLHASYTFEETTEVLVTTQSGYVFVQTDKPIYTPNQKVKIRVVSLEQNMLPSNRTLHVEVMNPQGITVKRLLKTEATQGFLTGDYQFPSVPVFGNWSVSAFYGPELKLNSTVKFEVKKYVLPTFSVKVIPPNYILEGAQSFTTEIDAQYVFGKPVRGRYIFKFGVVEEDGSVTYIDEPIKGRLNEQGHASVRLQNLDALFGENWFDAYEGHHFHAEAIVYESATGFSESRTNTSAIFAASPYKFSYKRTLQYFKRSISMQVVLDLTFANGHPAGGVPVSVRAVATLSGGVTDVLREGNEESNTHDDGRFKISFNVPQDADTIRIECRTRDPQFEGNQAILIFTVQASESPNNMNMKILPTNAPSNYRVDEEVSFQIMRTGNQGALDIHYMFITAGKVVDRGTISNEGDDPDLSKTITQDMVPTTRLFVYSVTGDGHVIADSLALDIEEQCRGEVSLRFTPDLAPPLPPYYRPSNAIQVHVTAPPSSRVGLMGVDNAVYLLRNTDRLTKRKMFERMKGYEIGCGPGGGQNSAQIFKDSGLTVLTNANLDVSKRETIGCENTAARRRRSVDLAAMCIEQLPVLASCVNSRVNLGRALRSGRWSCQARVANLRRLCPVADADLETYRGCCEEALAVVTLSSVNFASNTFTGRGLGDADEVVPDIGDVPERSDFRETWFFDEVDIPENGERVEQYVAPSSITEWKIAAVSVSPLLGMCVDDTPSLNVFQPFFIQLHMPYSIVRLEQAEITATIFNYESSEMTVTVNFTAPEGVCTENRPGVPIIREIVVPANNAKSLTFIVRPVEVGEFPIRVSAGPGRSKDRVQKILKVVPQGVPKTVPSTVVLNPGQVMFEADSADTTTAPPSGHAIDAEIHHIGERQVQNYNLSLPQDFILDTEFCSVSFIGNLLGTLGADPIGGLEKWLRQPTGCGEQTMIYLAPTLYAYKYLQSVNQDSPQLEDRVYGFLSDGVARELTYRQPSGAYAAWTHRPGSTWLTAFVVKVFSEASQFIPVETWHVEGSIGWLISNNQNAVTGVFTESQHVIHQEMIGAVKGDISMTAFVLVSLLESRDKLVGMSDDIDDAIGKARRYLETKVEERSIVRVYDKAITAYALARAESTRALDANNILIESAIVDPDSGAVNFDPNPQNYGNNVPFWLRRGSSADSVETTAYALLAQMELANYQYAGRIAIWLSNQQNYDGGFVSTQDTVVATQALARYAERPQFDHVNLDCRVDSRRSPSINFRHRINDDNAKILTETDVTEAIGGLVTLEATGYGVGKASVVLKYNTEATDIETCPFSVTITATEVLQPDRNRADLNISLCARYQKESSTHMSIISIGLYSGYAPVDEDLEQITNSSDLVASYELEGRSVIFYVDKIPNDESLCFSFKATPVNVVGNIQPAPVRVYDYYNPDDSCTVFYRPGEGSPLLSTLCSANECLCTRRGACGAARQRYTQAQLEEAACESQEAYALRVQVNNSVEIGGFRAVNVTVITPIKTGLDGVSSGESRVLYVDAACQYPRFLDGRTYLLVGKRALKFTLPNGQEGYKYYIDSATKVEFWPTGTANRTRNVRRKLNEFQTTMAMRGCST